MYSIIMLSYVHVLKQAMPILPFSPRIKRKTMMLIILVHIRFVSCGYFIQIRLLCAYFAFVKSSKLNSGVLFVKRIESGRPTPTYNIQ